VRAIYSISPRPCQETIGRFGETPLTAQRFDTIAANVAPYLRPLKEQLGLKLQSIREPTDVIIIDRIETERST
jgi:hypothetical protein